MNYKISEAPELNWLKTNSLSNATPEGEATSGKEYKRTRCSLELFDHVLFGNYDAFSACQPENVRITLESFNQIKTYVNSVLKTPDDEYAMRAFLVINDLGKVDDFVEKIAEKIGVLSVDHDKILYEGLKAYPELSPTFFSLSKKYQNIILRGLSTTFNMGQYVQCECLPANLVPLMNIDYETLNYYMIHVLFDISGAAGHVNGNGSLVCNELYWKKFSYALETILCMVKGQLDPEEAYAMYIESTMEIYKVCNPVVAKLCNMMRLSNSKEAEQLELAFNNLDDFTQNVLISELMKTGVNDTATLLYYAPATFQNALNYFKKNDSNNAIVKSFNLVSPVMAKIYKSIRSKINSNSGVTTVLISDVAKVAIEPYNLQIEDWFIERVGDDFKVISKKEKI